MIHVLAAIRVRPGRRADFLAAFNARVPQVHREPGCLEYRPAIDLETDLPMQLRDENLITIIEKWESVAHLKTHLATKEMQTYREQVQELVEEVSLRVLTDA